MKKEIRFGYFDTIPKFVIVNINTNSNTILSIDESLELAIGKAKDYYKQEYLNCIYASINYPDRVIEIAKEFERDIKDIDFMYETFTTIDFI